MTLAVVYEWTLRAHAQTAQQLGLTRTTARKPISLRETCLIGHLFFNPRGLRAWQLAEEHGLALERQAEEHHRSEAEQKRESRKLPSQAEKRRE